MTTYLDFHDIDALARQAVDLLDPEAELRIEETERNNAYVYPQATGGDHGSWRITVMISGSSAVLTIDPTLRPVDALAELIRDLGAVSHGVFRGRPFPECPGHDHPARVTVDGDTVVLVCPDDQHECGRITPKRPAR